MRIAIFAGDGVGPEVMAETRELLEQVFAAREQRVQFDDLLIGGAAIDAYGEPLRDEDVERARSADAILLGAVGGPKWDNPNAAVRPEQGLLKIRKALGLYANLRPLTIYEPLIGASPIKPDRLRGTDLLVVRELTGGLYFGEPSEQRQEASGRVAVDTLIYHEHEIERAVRLAFDLARERRSDVTSVDKANVLASSRLWRSIVTEVAVDYPDVAVEHMLVDAMAMKLVQQPAAFDVIVTENMFGDILTDEASVLGGSIGLLPSASLGAEQADGTRVGLYEPIHGSAPDIAGQDKANPAGMFLSAAMMLRLSLNMPDAAQAIERAVAETVAEGPDVLTGDLGGRAPTRTFGNAVRSHLAAAG